jgi:hypothetical protein
MLLYESHRRIFGEYVVKTPEFPLKTNHQPMIGVLLYESHRRIFGE